MKQANTVPVLEKAMEILEYIGTHPEGVTRPELQRVLGIPQATCYRIVSTLLERNWLSLRANQRYDISRGLADVARNAFVQAERYRDLQPVMNRLARESGFSVKFSVLDGESFVNVCSAKAASDVVLFSAPGFRAPLEKVASVSTIFLDALSRSVRERLLAPAEQLKLEDNLDFLRRTGYSFLEGASEPNAEYPYDTLSFPVRREERLVGVLSFLSLPGRLRNAIPVLEPLVREAIPDFLRSL